MKRIIWVILGLILSVSLIGCKSLKNNDSEPTVTTESEENEKVVETPDDVMALIINQIKEEMRVFDVGDHHAILYDMISEKSVGLDDDQIRLMIKETVQTYMDAYFRAEIIELLMSHNAHYSESDVETVFNNTSRTALYELIELYEWTFYKNNRQ